MSVALNDRIEIEVVADGMHFLGLFCLPSAGVTPRDVDDADIVR